MAGPNETMRQGWVEGASGWVANEPVIDHAFAPAQTRVPAARVVVADAQTADLLAEACGSHVRPGW
ncbi:hypothetical protein [Actinotalea caeni]|uniref:hypothetical protein n=1 Tax=Actinotalea caeni TaxID=1348467 RepID=UPI0012E0E877|nr:hypothetical protein [Actinotalea caeni]